MMCSAPPMRDDVDGLVSIITIFFNAERFLDEAIASVLSQTYPHWELLLVDDASTDGSRSIAERHVRECPERIKYLRHPDGRNHGLSASRNLGLAHARGAYVCFLDADDVYLPGKLERQFQLLQAYPTAAMVYGVTRHWFSWTGRPEDAARDLPKRLGVAPNTLVHAPDLVPLFLSGVAQTPGTSGFMVRRDIALRVGGFEDSFRAMAEDAVFLFKIALQHDVFVEGGQWDLYRQHPSSLTNAMRTSGEYRSSGPNPSRRRFLTWLDSYLTDNRIADPRVWQELNHQMRPYRSRLHFGLQETGYQLRRIWNAARRVWQERHGRTGA